MHILYTSPGSPYGRKARVAIMLLGLESKVRVETASLQNPDDPIHKVNPLRKMPALLTADGDAIFDSPVIVAFIDHLAGGDGVIPVEPKARFRALTQEALADGLMDATVAIRMEDRWHEAGKRSADYAAHQQKKIDGALSAFAAAFPVGKVDIGQIALACALGYLDNIDAEGWRARYPTILAWLEDFGRRVPALEATRVPR